MDTEALKQEAGKAACTFVQDGMKVGLGTGSTVKYTLIELGRMIQENGLEIVGVPTSTATASLAKSLGIPLAELDEIDGLDIVIDGADEVDAQFQLIKGGGAALLREKIVAQASKQMIVVVDERKIVSTLGSFPLPIEITPFSALTTQRSIANLLQCDTTLRMKDGNPLQTDNGNFIIDAHTGASIHDPVAVEQHLLHLAGVVQVGLFTNLCDIVIVAGQNGVNILTKA